VAYYGAFDPRDVGITYELPTQKPAPLDDRQWLAELPSGWYVVSVNYLCGDRRPVFDGQGTSAGVPKDAYTAFRLRTPNQRLGGSIWLFSQP